MDDSKLEAYLYYPYERHAEPAPQLRRRGTRSRPTVLFRALRKMACRALTHVRA